MNFTKAHFIKNRPKDPAGVQLTKRKTAKVNQRKGIRIWIEEIFYDL